MSPAECINWQEYTLLELERSFTISLWKPSHKNLQNAVFKCSIISLQKSLHGIVVQNCRWLELSVASVFSLSYANCESSAPNSPNVSQFLSSCTKFKFKFISCVLLNCLMTLHYHTSTGIICNSKTVLFTMYFEISLQQSGCTIIKTVITHFKLLPSCIFFSICWNTVPQRCFRTSWSLYLNTSYTKEITYDKPPLNCTCSFKTIINHSKPTVCLMIIQLKKNFTKTMLRKQFIARNMHNN